MSLHRKLLDLNAHPHGRDPITLGFWLNMRRGKENTIHQQ
jgi:hypothetical protein